jgi:spore coat protein U-like protein
LDQGPIENPCGFIKHRASQAGSNPIRTQSTGASLLLAVASTLLIGRAEATTQTTTFQVTANVQTTCTTFAQDLVFGAYKKNGGSPLLAQSNISVSCTNGTNWNLGLDKGLHGPDVLNRAMANSADAAVLLNYAIFKDPARTLNWGETVGTDTVSGVGTGVVQDIGAYGRIPAGQTTVTAGGYADTITVTLTF